MVRQPVAAPLGTVVRAAGLGLLCCLGVASADCSDYGDYPHWAGGVSTPGQAWGVAVPGSYAHVADGECAGLQVIEIADPTSPRIVGCVATPGDAFGVAISDTHAYVADASSGLTVLPTQCEPSSGVRDNVEISATVLLNVHPNPDSRQAFIEFAARDAGPVEVGVHDTAGRRICRLHAGAFPAGAHHLLWDGRDESGRAVAGGTYFIRASTPAGSIAARFVMVR